MLWLNPSDNQGVRFLIDVFGKEEPGMSVHLPVDYNSRADRHSGSCRSTFVLGPLSSRFNVINGPDLPGQNRSN